SASTARGRVRLNTGIERGECASDLPRASSSSQPKSCASPMIIENAVRQSVTQHSSVMFTRRLQRTSRVTGSKSVANAHPQVAQLTDAQAISPTEDGRRFPLFDDRRTRDVRAGPERVAVVDRSLDGATLLRKIGGPVPAGGAAGRRCEARQPYLWVGTER